MCFCVENVVPDLPINCVEFLRLCPIYPNLGEGQYPSTFSDYSATFQYTRGHRPGSHKRNVSVRAAHKCVVAAFAQNYRIAMGMKMQGSN